MFNQQLEERVREAINNEAEGIFYTSNVPVEIEKTSERKARPSSALSPFEPDGEWHTQPWNH
jgi:hypothetical protein